MKPMQAIAVALLLVTAGEDSDAAFRDLARFPPEEQGTIVYLTTSAVAPQKRASLVNAVRFVVPSLSSKSYLPDQLPVEVAGTNLLRMRLDGLGWEQTWAKVIEQRYVPDYRPDLLNCKFCGKAHVPLVVRADWLVAVLTDPELSGNAQQLLLYGRELKTANEFRTFWTVNGKSDLAFGLIEGKSGVANQGTRLLENLPTSNRAWFWQTFDSEVVAGNTDPLENLTARPPKHDASELIAGVPKHYGSRSGALQAYFLADGKGNAQTKAPADIVTDHSGIRGAEIRNTISCVACHDVGILHPTLNQYKAYILSGARIYTKDKAVQQEIDRYLDSPIAKEIERNNQDYAAAVKLCNGLTPRENLAVFKQIVALYDAPVSVEQAARELYAEPEAWRLALGDYSRRYSLPGRLALMAQGESMSRDQWRQNFHLAQKVMQSWHAQQ